MNVVMIGKSGVVDEYRVDLAHLRSDPQFLSNAAAFDCPKQGGYALRMGLMLGWLRKALNAESGTIYVLEGHSLRLAYVQNERLARDGIVATAAGENLYAQNSEIIDKRTIYGYTVATRKCVRIDSFPSIPYKAPFYVSPRYDDWTGYVKESVVTVPVVGEDDAVAGVIQFVNKRDPAGVVVGFDDDDPARILSFLRIQKNLMADIFRECLDSVGTLKKAAPVVLAHGDEKRDGAATNLPWLDGSGLVWNETERTKESAISRRLLLFTDYIYCFKDMNTLMDIVLTEARDATHADAGIFHIVEDDKWLSIAAMQNDTLFPNTSLHRLHVERRIPLDARYIVCHAADQRRMINIYDAWNLPEQSPYEFDRRFDDATGYRTASVLSIPISEPDGRVFAVMQLINAKDAAGNVKAFDQAAEVYVQYLSVHVMPHLLAAVQSRKTIERMLHMLGMHNPYEDVDHALRVATVATIVFQSWAKRRGLPQPTITARRDLLFPAAMMHDVGMVCIPMSIVGKNGPLTDEDRLSMQEHPALGARMFEEAEMGMERVAYEVTMHHHQRWDGKGYTGSAEHPPLAKEEIPISARVVALADAFDALTTARPYAESFSFNNALDELRKNSGTQFDPEVVSAALAVEHLLYDLYKRYGEPGGK